MKFKALVTAVATTIVMTGCSMTNGTPSIVEGTIKKWNTMSNVESTAGRPNWQYKITEVTNESSGQVVYVYDMKEMLNLLAGMYIRLPEGRYTMDVECYLSRPSQGDRLYKNTESLSVLIKANQRTKINVTVSNRKCHSTYFSSF